MSASLGPLLFVGVGLVVVARLLRGAAAHREGERSSRSAQLRSLPPDLEDVATLPIDDEAPAAETLAEADPRPPASDGAPQVSSRAERDSIAAIYRTIYGPGLCSPR